MILAALLALSACSSGTSLVPEETTETEVPASTTEEEVITVEGNKEELRAATEAYFDGFDEEVYYVGPTRDYTSFVELLLDLEGNSAKKTIYIDEGEYDLFREYELAVAVDRLVIPPDDVVSSNYMGKYNAFVPNNTRIVGQGKVTLRFTPDKDDISYGASRTWSPLNIYGSVMIENVNVRVKNCRYALHNDDHNKYPGSRQYYKNCRFVYELSDKDANGRLLGFNNTIGYGVNTNSVHVFDNCEIFFDGEGQHSAFYGHNPSGTKPGEGEILLTRCHIHASDESNLRVIRLQTLSTGVAGHVVTTIDRCKVNGGLTLNLYNSGSIQSYEVTYFHTAHQPVDRTHSKEEPFEDPYEIRYVD